MLRGHIGSFDGRSDCQTVELEMNISKIRELDIAELDQVAGGWKTCPNGTKNGATGYGLVPDYVECGPYTNAEFVRDIIRYGGGRS